MIWLLRLPQWAALLVLVGGLVGLALLAFLLVHRRWPADLRRRHNEVAGFIYAVAGVMYAALLGFVVVILWEQYSEATAATEQEAAVALALQHELGSSASADNSSAEAARRTALVTLHAYVRSVVDAEFVQMAAGDTPPAATPTMAALWMSTSVSGPAAATGTLSRARDLLDDLEEARGARLAAAGSTMPAAVWVAIGLGGALTIGFGCLFGAESALAQGMMLAALTGLISVLLFVAVELDHPFIGRTRVRPVSFEQILTVPSR
jgi:Protein of unknown function (DUF4239)